jgi:hypothetical protein
MIGTMTARRRNAGASDEFRDAWDATYRTQDEIRRWSHIYHARDLSDPDIIVSFGLFDGTANELRAIQARHSSDNADARATRRRQPPRRFIPSPRRAHAKQ